MLSYRYEPKLTLVCRSYPSIVLSSQAVPEVCYLFGKSVLNENIINTRKYSIHKGMSCIIKSVLDFFNPVKLSFAICITLASPQQENL